MDEIQRKASQIFEYLLAVKNKDEKIIRNLDSYDEIWWEKELPNTEGCYMVSLGRSR